MQSMQLVVANSNIPGGRLAHLPDTLPLDARVCLRAPVSGLARITANRARWNGESPCIVTARSQNPKHPPGEMTITLIHNGKKMEFREKYLKRHPLYLHY